jgi:hypothetical protein
VRMTYTLDGGHKELIVTSAYLPYDSDEPPPSKEVRDIVEHCQIRKKQLIIGCDVNSHHILWGNTEVNPRGECLMEYLVNSNLNILNQSKKPASVVRNRQEVIHLTPGINRIGDLVSNWHVSDDPFLSAHRYIYFQTHNIKVEKSTYRNPQRTNWESYKDELKVNLGTISRNICTIKDVDWSVDRLQRAIVSSFQRNCPARTTRAPRMPPWWNKQMSGLRTKTRRLFNTAKRTG